MLNFGDKEQNDLSTPFNYIHNKSELIMLNNSDPKNNDAADNFFDNLYSNFTITCVPAKQMIGDSLPVHSNGK